MSDDPPLDSDQQQPAWRPLNPTQRRVLGVLMEKAKTTPDAYPMTLKAITTGSNQKSNRDPQMELDTDQVEQALEELREMKAVAEIQGDGRVAKFRHFAYEWFGVNKEEMAVMAELLLRGEQTVGELRGRAARMEPIAGMSQLLPILGTLQERKLVLALTPAGRGQTVTHGLLKDREISDLQRRFGAALQSIPAAPAVSESHQPPAAASHAAPQATPAPSTPLVDELTQLRNEVAQLRKDVDEIKALLS